MSAPKTAVTSHLLLAGGWAVCPAPESCELAFHVPGMTPAEAEALPRSVLESLLEVVQPPTASMWAQDSDPDKSSGKFWTRADAQGRAVFLHREYDLPAAIYDRGAREWWVRGQLHRVGKPAVIFSSGSERWFQRGKLHRGGDKPAVITQNLEGWFWRDRRHRLRGPAMVRWALDGALIEESYWFFGRLHRLFGPAVVDADGSKEWWLFGRQVRSRREQVK